jgi:hypothetical protein
MMTTIVVMNDCMARLLRVAGELEEQELESTDAAHQLLDRRRPAGRGAQLAVHGG